MTCRSLSAIDEHSEAAGVVNQGAVSLAGVDEGYRQGVIRRGIYADRQHEHEPEYGEQDHRRLSVVHFEPPDVIYFGYTEWLVLI